MESTAVGAADPTHPAECERAVVGGVLFAFLLAFTVDADALSWMGGGAGDELGACGEYEPFYAPGELPVVHEIDLRVEKAAFTAMTGRMWDRNQPELQMNISFDGVLLQGAKVQLHGGPFQRGQAAGQKGGSCHDRDTTDGLPACKPGFRLNFNKRDQLPSEPRLFGHPAGLAGCSPPDKVVLRSEWNDLSMMVRNKLSTDLYNKLGSPVVRVEYARVSVDGTYWGLFTLEEHVDTDFLKCRQLPDDEEGTALYKPFPDMMMDPSMASANHASWTIAGCEDDPVLCTLSFERKLPKCDGCDNGDAFTKPELIFGPTGPQLGPQPPECSVQETAALNATCPEPTDLFPLFHAISVAKNQDGNSAQAKAKLLQALNVTSYMVWQMVTIFNADCDHGGRNYYIYKPKDQQPWNVISYDMDWGWGACYMPWTPGPSHRNIGCNCDALNDHGSSDLNLYFFTIPLTFSSFVAFVLFHLSCYIDCMHWNPYWRWRNAGGLSDSLLSDQPVLPVGTIDASDKPEEKQSNPLSQTAGNETVPGGGSESVEAAAAASPWAVPPDRCCSSQFSAWGIATPQTNLQALRQQHENEHKISAGADQTSSSVQPDREGAREQTTSADLAQNFYPPTIEGVKAFKRSLQQACSDGRSELDKREWARAGCTLACNWIRLHPTTTSAMLLLLSFWVGYGCNLFLLMMTEWIFLRVYCAPVCALFWCAPAGRFTCSRTPNDPPCCSQKCFGTCFSVFLVCTTLINPLTVWVMAVGCQTSCELTGWQPGSNEMEQPLETLFASEYFGLYRDFLDQDFTQPCVLAGALDNLIGPDGVIREALVENHQHWNYDVSSIDEQIRQTKGWIARHGSDLRSAVATRCDTMSGDCIRGATCLAGGSSCGVEERCEQGSLQSSCVSRTDVCGCTSGGWSTTNMCCSEAASTSEREASACAAGSLGVPLSVACGETHYDWCGCSPGNGWSSTNACCSSSSSSSDSELEACRASAGQFAAAPRAGPLC